MGFIKAFAGALSGTLADQWKDFYQPMQGAPASAAIIPAVKTVSKNKRSSDKKNKGNIITNESKILVPEGAALVTIQDGAITGIVAEAGGYIFTSDDVNSQSIFSGDGIIGSILESTREKVKFDGQASSQHLAFYVNLKEIPNNRFGTQSEIYRDDAFLGTQVGAITRGSYSLRIVDPLLFVKNFVPQKYLSPNAPVFDFADMENDAGSQLFNEVVSSLSQAFANYTNDPSKGNRMAKIQADQVGFAASLSKVVEENYGRTSDRGLEIVKTAILAIEYDQDTKELLKDVKRADALSGARGNSFMQESVARGIQAAGEKGSGSNMAFMGMGMSAAENIMGNIQQEDKESSYNPNFGKEKRQEENQDPTEKLIQMKKLLDAGVISQEEFDKVRKDLLGF